MIDLGATSPEGGDNEALHIAIKPAMRTEVGHPHESGPQFGFVFQSSVEDPLHEIVGTNWGAQDFDALRVPRIFSQMVEIWWPCSTTIPRACLANVQPGPCPSKKFGFHEVVHSSGSVWR